MLRKFQLPVTVHHWWRNHIQDHLCKLQIDWYCFSNIPNGEALTTLKLTLLSRPYHSNTNSNSWNSLFHVLSWDIEKKRFKDVDSKPPLKEMQHLYPFMGIPNPRPSKWRESIWDGRRTPSSLVWNTQKPSIRRSTAQSSNLLVQLGTTHTSHGRFCGYHCCLTSHLRTRVEPKPYPGISSTMYYW